MKNTVLVVPGNVGDHVGAQLVAKGIPVRLLVRKFSGSTTKGVEQVIADFSDPQSLAPAFHGVQKFFLLLPAIENLVQLGKNAIEAARLAGIEHIVRSSVMDAAEDAAIRIPRLHGHLDKALIDSGIPYTLLCPNTFMQNYLGQAAAIKGQNAFYLNQADAGISLVDVHDIAAIAVCALTEPGHAGKTYTITGAEALSNPEIAAKLSTALGKKITYVNVTDEQATAAMRAAGVNDWNVSAMVEFMQLARAGYLARVYRDVENVLHRKARSFDTFLQDNLQAFLGAAAAG